MKKILTVLLVLTLSVVGLFADFIDSTKNTITLNATVPPAEPRFEISASTVIGFDNDPNKTVAGGQTLNIGVDPSNADVNVYFKLRQNNTARYDKTLTVTVTGEKFEKTINTVTYKTELPTISTETTTTTGTKVTTTNEDTTTKNIYKIDLAYDDFKRYDANDIIVLKYTWAHNESLAADTYTSSIKVSIQAN